MTIISFIRLIMYHLKVLLIVPVVMVLMVFFLMKDAKKDYRTTATIYTGFASGYSLTSSDRPDYTKINIKFDNFFQNIKSRETREEIVLRTLAYYLSRDSISNKEMTPENQLDFALMLPPELLKEVVIKNDEETTYANLLNRYNQGFDNEINLLLNSKNYFFGLDQLLKLSVKREGSSDIVKLDYGTKDAGICYNTTRIAIDVILGRVKKIKALESSDVVNYFLEESEKAKLKLYNAEQELSKHMTQNNIINYYEQTKFISSRREDYETANQEEELKYSASQAAIKETEKKLSSKENVRLKSQSILDLRNQLGKITSQLVYIEINGVDIEIEDSNPKSSKVLNIKSRKQLGGSVVKEKDESSTKGFDNSLIKKLKQKARKIKTQIQKQIEDLHNINQTSDGVKSSDILDIWLESVIYLEESRARLKQYEVKRREFDVTYSKFAKLGSVIKEMERKIDVIERDYLALLSSLNAAKLQQQNIEMATSLKVVDTPFYPVNAEASKKPLFMIIAFLVGFILPLGIIIILEFLDNTIKTPERAREFTQLYLAGGFPLILPKNLEDDKDLHSRLINQMSSYINYVFHNGKKKDHPFIVLFFSTRKNEGKTQLAQLIANDIRNAGEPTLVISPIKEDGNTSILPNEDKDNITYKHPRNYSDICLNEATISQNKKLADYRFIFFEIPAIIGSDLPIEIMRNAHLSLLILKSSRGWNEADSLALENYSNIIDHKVSSIINGTHTDVLESIIGEIPKKRSWLRKKIKRIAKFQFKSNRF